MATKSKKSAKSAKSAKKSSVKKSVAKRGPSRLDAVIKLLLRKEGATLTDTVAAGFNQPVKAALNAAEKRGYKTRSAKEKGELRRYYVTGRPSASA